MNLTGRDHRDLDLIYNTAPFLWLRRDFESFHCGSESMGRRDAWLWNDRDCAAGVAPRRLHTIRHNGDHFYCCAECKRKTQRQMGFDHIGPAGFEPATCRRGDRTTTVIHPIHLDRDPF